MSPRLDGYSLNSPRFGWFQHFQSRFLPEILREILPERSWPLTNSFPGPWERLFMPRFTRIIILGGPLKLNSWDQLRDHLHHSVYFRPFSRELSILVWRDRLATAKRTFLKAFRVWVYCTFNLLSSFLTSSSCPTLPVKNPASIYRPRDPNKLLIPSRKEND